MRVGVAQINCEVGSISANTEKMLRLVQDAKQSGCDAILFPEMSDTGYVMPVILQTASPWTEGPAVALRRAAEKHRLYIVAGLSERDGPSVFNSIAFIGPDGSILGKYRKTHLVTAEPMLEHRHLKAGDELVLGHIGGILVGFMTCYDVRFPEIACNLAAAGAEIIFLPAAFPLIRIAHWKVLSEARAIENQLFIVAANRIGTDGPGLAFGGASRVIDPQGALLASASETEEKLLLVDLDLGVVKQTRAQLQIHQDRRPDLYAKPVKILKL